MVCNRVFYRYCSKKFQEKYFEGMLTGVRTKKEWEKSTLLRC